MKTLFMLMFLLGNVVNCFSQGNYNDYSEKDKTKIFVDEFNLNSNNWWTGRSAGVNYGVIESGYYQYESLNHTQTYVTKYTVNIDQTRDFEMETALQIINKGDTKNASWASQFFWGVGDNGSFNFNINYDEFYWISCFSGGKYNDWCSFTKKYVNKLIFNKLTVRKVGNQYYFFVNENFVYSHSFEPFFGNQIGFAVAQNNILKIDYLRVNYLSDKQPDRPAKPTEK